MKKVILAVAAVALLSGVSGAAFAVNMYEKIDANKDGVVTKAESQAFNEQRFNEVDTNKDGKITLDERKAHYSAMQEKRAARKAERAAKATTSAGKKVTAQ